MVNKNIHKAQMLLIEARHRCVVLICKFGICLSIKVITFEGGDHLHIVMVPNGASFWANLPEGSTNNQEINIASHHEAPHRVCSSTARDETFQFTCDSPVVLPIHANIPIFVRVVSTYTSKSLK